MQNVRVRKKPGRCKSGNRRKVMRELSIEGNPKRFLSKEKKAFVQMSRNPVPEAVIHLAVFK